MNGRSRGLWLALGLVLAWRLALLLFTAQPIPANDAFLFDGAVVNWLRHGEYFNPSLAESFPISGRQVFAAYPPLYQAALLPWMWLFGTGVLSAMWLHYAMFCVAGLLVAKVIGKMFPAGTGYALAVFFLLAITFDDRPEGLAHIFGLAALWLAARRLGGNVRSFPAEAGITLALLCALYTSVIVGAFYFGAIFLTRASAWLFVRRRIAIGAFIAVTGLFAGIAWFIAIQYPLLWEGFLENSRQTPVLTAGFRRLAVGEILKLVRTGPVFLLAVAVLPLVVRQSRLAGRLPASAGENVAWLSLTTGIIAMGWLMLAAAMVLVSPNYVAYVLFVQPLLAAGLLALGEKFSPKGRRWLHVALAGCVALVSIRAAGMTTWGVLCARDVGYGRAHEILREELKPYANSGERTILSAAFLYGAAQLDLREAIHSDWPYDRRFDTPTANFEALVRLRPPKVVVTQFDYHRTYSRVVAQLRQHPELVAVRVRDTATVRTPDSIPSLQRVVQHISWAPVIVELSWK